MTFNEYQAFVNTTALYPDRGNTLIYPALGLCGEAGEVAEKIKKFIRDGSLDRVAVARELGDVLWYVAALSTELGYELADIAELNREKLLSRKVRGTLQGSGDNR